MKYFIQTVPSGETRFPRRREGTIIGVVAYPDSVNLNTQAFIDAGIATIEMPSDFTFADINEISGGYLATPLTAGVKPASTFTNRAALIAALTKRPLVARLCEQLMVNDGTNWSWREKLAKKIATLNITTAGTGYTVTTDVPVVCLTGDAYGGTVDITSVGSSGEVTGVALNTGGVGYKVGNTVKITGGNDDAVLTIGTIATIT